MSATVKEKPVHNFIKNNVELSVVEPTKLLFKVVVNTYKEIQAAFDIQRNEINEKVVKIQHGLPPQPKEYLKFPTYDWF